MHLLQNATKTRQKTHKTKQTNKKKQHFRGISGIYTKL